MDTGKSYVYSIKNPLLPENYVKIGKSDDPLRRIREGNTWSPFGLELVFAKLTENAIQEENKIHQTLSQYNITAPGDGSAGKEWFDIPIEQVTPLFENIPGEWYEDGQNEVNVPRNRVSCPHIRVLSNLLDKTYDGVEATGQKEKYVSNSSCNKIIELIGDDKDEFLSLTNNPENDLSSRERKKIIKISENAKNRIANRYNYAYPKAYLNSVIKHYRDLN